MPGTRYAGRVELERARYYYGGTDQLLEGYALCFDLSATPGTNKDSLGMKVTKPATANLAAFAGIVAEKKKGPNFVDVWFPQPGQPVRAYTHANMTAGTTGLGVANADYGLVAHSDSALNLPLVGVALETADTSTTAANKWVLFK